MKAPEYDPGVSQSAVWSARLGLIGTLMAAMALALSAANRVSPRVALVILACAALFGLGGLAFAWRGARSIWLLGKRGMAPLLTGLLFACCLLAAPAYLGVQALRLPLLHDVATDTSHPLQFSGDGTALAARHGQTPAEPTADERAQQSLAYPDVQPILVDVTPLQAFELALRAAKALHWTIVATQAASKHDPTYHIDATDQMPLLHLVDDITIRVEPENGQARVDIRSVSRLGGPDFGANANRILRFINEYQTLVDSLE